VAWVQQRCAAGATWPCHPAGWQGCHGHRFSRQVAVGAGVSLWAVSLEAFACRLMARERGALKDPLQR
jgi:hypothetical protein